MKRLIILVAVVLVILAAFWAKDRAERKAAAESPQADPIKTVEAFLDSVSKLNAVIYEQKQRESLEADVDELQEKGEAATEEEVRDVFEKYGLKPPYHLFEDERYGKAAITTMLLYRFDSFTVKAGSLAETTATVGAEFTPADILGLRALSEKLGAPASKEEPRPIEMVFSLEKERYRWYIKEIGGELAQGIRAFGRLRGLR